MLFAQRRKLPPFVQLLAAFVAVAAVQTGPHVADAQVGYTRHLSKLRIEELQQIATRLEHSINAEKYPCDNYYEYVCGRNKPLYSVLGHLPHFEELIRLLTELQEDPLHFAAKQKLMDFFISCNSFKSLEQCYHESFVHFRPLFGYIIAKRHIDRSSHEYEDFMRTLNEFLSKAERTDNFHRNPIRMKLATLRDRFRKPRQYFHISDLDSEYDALRIYRESYTHNMRNLAAQRRRNSTYELGVSRTMLDWSLYIYQSRHKPMSYYFATLNVHLWMALYNSTERAREPKWFADVGECLKLPQFVNVLEEARILAVVYLKSFRQAWLDYREWLEAVPVRQEIVDQENELLKPYNLDNKKLFFTLYAQNFCEFGKELAESVFFVGLKQNQDFYAAYSCGYQSERGVDCV